MGHEDAPWAEGLNAAQRAAVAHDGGPLLVVAGAGTGKTRTLAARVGRLLWEGAEPERILLLTFSRRAAREMLRRAEHLGADRATTRVWGGTFHAVGNRLLREHGRAVGLSPDLSILDAADATELLGVVRADLGLAERGRRFPKKETLLDIYSRVVNAQEPLGETLRRRFPWCAEDEGDIASVFTAYTERKRSRGLLDYDDLLLYWRALVTASPAADLLRSQFDHVLVDEYQDTNVLQADIVAGLSPSGRGLFVVGDDAQAIYGFRAAASDSMATFHRRFPDVEVVTLEENYRSVQPVLDVANALMTDASGLYAKELRTTRPRPDAPRPTLARASDEGAQAAFVCARLLEHREQGVPLREQAVLFRNGHHSGRLEIELARRRIPFVKYGGLKFLESAHIKDLLALLRLLDNPNDELAWHRALGLLEGVGPATIRSIMAALDLPNPRAVRTFVDDPPAVPPRARADVDLLREGLRACLDAGADTEGGVVSPASEVEHLRTVTRPLFERRYPQAQARLTDFEQIQAMAAACPTRSHLLAELTIDPPSRTTDLAGPPLLDDDYVVLSTIHSAKGCEWTAVYVIHASDGNIPSDMSLSSPEGLEEERRLFYVALTRARDHLYVTYPQRFYDRRYGLDDAHSWGQPSRFLDALAAHVDEPPIEHFADLNGDTVADAGPDTVTAQVTALWS